MLLIAAVNPGTFSPPTSSEYIGPFFFATLVFLMLALIMFTFGAGSTKATVIGCISTVLTISSLVAATSLTVTGSERASEARAAYIAEVIGWMASEYAIDVDAEHVQLLLDGDSFAAEYDGETVVVSKISDLDRDLVLVDENRTILKSVND